MGEAAAKVAADTAKAAADTALAASSKSVMIEERQYLLLGLIAEGGFAYVYRARDAATSLCHTSRRCTHLDSLPFP